MLRLVAALCLTLAASAALAQHTVGGEAVRVPTERVCMVQDRVFPNAQIPVDVQGRTYYGCCSMCEARLRGEAALREARDPVSGRAVDKASAVIAQTPDGSVLYFESEDTLRRFNERK